MEPAGTEHIDGKAGDQVSGSERVKRPTMRSSVTQFNVPVREIDEMLPEVVLRRGKSDLDERPPFWPFGSTDQAHVRFTRQPIAFARVARNARANHILPRCCSTAVARHDVIEIELAAVKNLAAVLAGVLVALEDVVPGKFHFLLWKPIENQKHNHPRDTNLKRNRGDYLVIRSVCRQVTPAFEIMCHEIVRLVR